MRLVLYVLLPGVVTILCHADGLLPSAGVGDVVNDYVGSLVTSDGTTGKSIVEDHTAELPFSGPKPRANHDDATTLEETQVTINVLANDTRGVDDDGDDDDDDRTSGEDDYDIDPETVDLNLELSGIQPTLTTNAGSYTVSRSGDVTFSPIVNFFGSTAIQYTIRSNSNETSDPAILSIEVVNVNDVPVITGAGSASFDAVAGQPVTITLGHVVVVDPDNGQTDLTITILPGESYSISENRITPNANFSGTLPVQVQVGDGEGTSTPFTLNFSVTQENVAPVISGQNPVSTPEDQAVVIISDHLQVTDPDNSWPADFTIQVGQGENYTVSGQTITPALEFSGVLEVPVTVNDGESTSNTWTLQVTVTAVNDRPVIAGQTQNPFPAKQNQSFTIALADLVVTDVDNPSTDFTVILLEGSNYNFSGATVTPTPGFTGALTVNVAVNDLSSVSDPFAFSVNVAANAAPVITGQTELSTNEETALAISLSNVMVTDPDNSYPDDFTLAIQPGTNYTVVGDVITPALNYAGPLSVPVTVSDGVNTVAGTLTVTVINVNDAPVISGHGPLTTTENQGIALDLSHLTIVDPDSETFTLSILSGNYTVSGNVITPPAGFNGVLTVPVIVSDGQASSNQFSVSITVSPVNDPPVITGQRAIQVIEGASILLSVADVTVADPDNTYPEGFTLIVQSGTNYTYAGTTVTPVANFFGDLGVNVVVNDGANNSQVFPLLVTVTPVNDPPVITGQAAITISEDTPREVVLADVVASDPDNTFPTGFTLIVSPGLNYTLIGNTLTPAVNYSGPLSVQVQVSDGNLTSNPFSLVITVLPVNDKPAITGQVPVETAEDTPVTILTSHLTVLDVDNTYPTGFTLVASPGANYSVSGTTITPAVDFNGTLNVPVLVNDGVSNSDPFVFQIQVGHANDAPLITGQASVSTSEESPVTLALSHLTVLDPDNPFPTGFTLLVSPGTNYTVSGTTITPAVNFAGVLAVPVRVTDGVNNSPTFNFQLQVNQVNDPPAFAAIANQQVAENTPAGSVTITGISKGPLEDYQQLTFVASSSNSAVIADPVIQYDGTSATAVLSYVVKPNASGVVTITVVAIDNGSNTAPNQNSYTSSFQVAVSEINTAPTLNAINTITIMEDAEQQNVPLSGISPGAGETQTVTVAVTTNKPEFFDLLAIAYTNSADNGLLQFKARLNVFGTAEVSITVTDNGSGVAPHVNTITRKFSVVIQPVNDLPVFTSQPVTVAVVQEDYLYTVTATDPDGEKVTIAAPVRPSWLALSNPSNNGQAMLTGRAPAGVLGEVSVTLQVKDAVATVDQSFVIYVNVRPTLVALSIITEEDTPVAFDGNFFSGGYTDQNDNPLQAVKVTQIPAAGKLLLGDVEVKAEDTILSETLSGLSYRPNENFYGKDSFGWNAFDGYNFNLNPATVDISVLSINDAPAILLQEDTLNYEVNGEFAFLVPLIDIVDPDDDTLSHATVAFHPASYRLDTDLLEFQTTGNIRGSFDFQAGVLRFTGVAPVADYRNALRSIRYLYQNTVDPLLDPKGITFKLSDGETESDPVNKIIMLQYTFVEFEIPSGFTPNGDQANDTWVIDRPGGGLEEMIDAVISVYNKQGILVYRTKGFQSAWDGTMNGELLPADTYFYTIDLQLRNNKTYKGIVTILR